MAKCIRLRDGTVDRVSDEEAHRLFTTAGAVYINKREYIAAMAAAASLAHRAAKPN